jgi:hypothetical protein
MPRLNNIDKARFLPWELTARLALLGYNEPTFSVWGKPKNLKKDWDCYVKVGNTWEHTTFQDRDDYYRRTRKTALERFEQAKGLDYNPLQYAFIERSIVTITPDEAKEWFRKTYDIDFFERPHIGREKKYVCDPLGGGLGTVKLEAQNTPREALEACLSYLCDTVKPLPLEEVKKEETNV